MQKLKRVSFTLIFLLLVSCSLQNLNKSTPIPTNSIVPPSTNISSNNLFPTATITTTLLPNFTPTHIIPTAVQPSITPSRIDVSTPTFMPIPMGRIAFPVYGGIGVIQTDGTGFSQLINDCIFCYSVSWSPDGHELAFDATYKHGELAEIYQTDKDGENTKQITYGPYNKILVAWSPNREYIAYVELHGDWTDDICVINIDKGEYQKLTFTSEAESSPAWSPDGKQIAFLRLLTTEGPEAYISWALMVMDSNGSNVKKITDFAAGRGRIAWSPDGQHLAFSSSGNCGEVYTIDADGSDLKQLTNLPGCAMNPTWSPDGKYIAFVSNQSDEPTFQWRINIINIISSDITTVYGGQVGNDIFRPDWMPVPSLLINESYIITDVGTNLNLRNEASVYGTTLKRLITGDVVTVLDGPVDVDDYYWWKLRTEDGTEGWAVEVYGWYQPVSP